MTVHLYLMPMIGSGAADDARRPKYAPSDRPWSAMDFGLHPFCLLAADVDDATDTSINGQADARRLPDNLDGTIGAGALAAVKAQLETMRIPTGWLAAGMTWRQTLRTVCAMFQLAQRFHGLHGAEMVPSQAALDLRLNQLTQAQRDRLSAVADSFGYDRSAFVGTTTVRQVMKALADQWGATPIYLGIAGQL